MQLTRTYEELIAQVEELQTQLAESHDTIEAIRSGEVDAFIVKNNNKHELYTLKTADQTYRVFIEKMAEGAVTINKEGIILYSNTSFSNMVNLPLEKVLGHPFWNFIPPHYKGTMDAVIKHAWHREVKTEVTLQRSNEQIPVLLSLNALEIDGGVALSIIVTNLSYQKEAQEQLKQKNYQLEQAQLVTKSLNEHLEETVRLRTNELFKSREQFKFLADNIPAIVWTTNAKGQHDYFNNRWFEFTGSKDLMKSQFSSFIHQDDCDKYLALWKHAVSNGAPFEMIHRLKKGAEGNYKWHFSQAMPYKNASGEIVCWFGISTDIDEQKQALEKKDEFISIASHELKTPVTSIKGYVQLLQFNFENEGNTRAVELLGKVDAQVNKLTNLISDLLDVKKIENGQLQYHNELFDFNELVREIVEETGRVLKKHVLSCNIAETRMVFGDRNKIGQVITNFVDNAGKYSPPGSEILVTTINKDKSIRLAVQDFGIGIPKDQLGKIFERFFRVSQEKENTYAGLGLGLYISAEIIKRHKGIIGVETEKDKGSTFYFELPVQ
jgi:two-component system, OmpR family, phosphate regulon sensor histidine kinase PhoR